jgi:hypothetical protein
MANSFDVLKEMGKRNGKIQLAPLGNLIEAKYSKKGTRVVMGVAGNVVTGLLMGQYVGGLILADKEEFDRISKELDAAPVGAAVVEEG